MAIKRGSKVDKSFSSASMTDLIFLLLLFMLIATTLINPNAIKLILPKSSNQLKDNSVTGLKSGSKTVSEDSSTGSSSGASSDTDSGFGSIFIPHAAGRQKSSVAHGRG